MYEQVLSNPVEIKSALILRRISTLSIALLFHGFLCIFAAALINISENPQRHDVNAELNSAGSNWSLSAFAKDIKQKQKQKSEHLDEESPISGVSNVIALKPPLVRFCLQCSG